MATSVPIEAPLPKVWSDRIAFMQGRLAEGTFTLDGMPGYVRGRAPSVDTWHHLDYLEIYPRIYGRECGANGIGLLREVALTVITDRVRAPATVSPGTGLDMGKLRDQSLEYQAKLEEAGVLVHRVDFPQPAAGAYGPGPAPWGCSELLILRGGSVIEKAGVGPLGAGRAEYLALWAFANLAIPPILTIMGKGVCEAGSCIWLAEDVFVTGHGLAYNKEGLDQLLPAVQRSARLAEHEMTTLTIHFPGSTTFNPHTGQGHHPDMVLAALDVGKVLAYPSGLDFGTSEWLRERGYMVIDIDREEQRRYMPANLTLIEPGRVIMHAEATRSIAAVRKAGVEVVETPSSEFLRAGGGLHASTLRIRREPGPYSTDRRPGPATSDV